MIRYILLFTLGVLMSCDESNTSEDKWKLLWEDDFNGNAGELPDKNKWKFDVGTGWGNNQLEYDTDRAENVSLDGDGNLAIVARQEDYEGKKYTSGRIKTEGLFEFTYGKIEARMKLPWGQGLWPAFWMLGSDFETVSWPQCGELDIMEYRGQEPSRVLGTVHGPGYSAGNSVGGHFDLHNDRFDNDFHVFAAEWSEEEIKFFVDDLHYYTVTPKDVTGEWVFDHPFFIILNLAVGGGYVGPPNSKTVFPQTLLVDYVRVYQLK